MTRAEGIEDDEDEDGDDLDDIDDLDAADFDNDGSPILHAGDVDGVDIDEFAEQTDAGEFEDAEESEAAEFDDDDERRGRSRGRGRRRGRSRPVLLGAEPISPADAGTTARTRRTYRWHDAGRTSWLALPNACASFERREAVSTAQAIRSVEELSSGAYRFSTV